MHNPTVFIIDSQKTRRELMAKAFKEADENVLVKEFWHGNYPDPTHEISCNLLLIHFRDLDSLKNRQEPQKTNLTIYYGGAGGNDKDWNNRQAHNSDERIWRIILPEGKGALTSKEARELLNYSQSLNSASPLPKPAVLQPFHECNVLLTLSVLCQGFLAAHASFLGQAEGVPDGDVLDVEIALRKMQWSVFCQNGKGRELLVDALLDDSPEGPKKRSLLRNQVCNTEYWQLLVNALQRQYISCEKAIESVKSDEWDSLSGQGNWEDVKTLLTAIWEPSLSSISPIIVAKALVQLTHRLGGA